MRVKCKISLSLQKCWHYHCSAALKELWRKSKEPACADTSSWSAPGCSRAVVFWQKMRTAMGLLSHQPLGKNRIWWQTGALQRLCFPSMTSLQVRMQKGTAAAGALEAKVKLKQGLRAQACSSHLTPRRFVWRFCPAQPWPTSESNTAALSCWNYPPAQLELVGSPFGKRSNRQ